MKIQHTLSAPKIDRERIRRESPSLLLLLEDIERQGMLKPIQITKDGQIIDGSHRYICAWLLGISEIEVEILNPPTPE